MTLQTPTKAVVKAGKPKLTAWDIDLTLKAGPTVIFQRHGVGTGTVSFVLNKTDALKLIKRLCPQPYTKNGVVYLERSVIPMVPLGYTVSQVSIDPINDQRPLNLFDYHHSTFPPKTYEDRVEVTVEFTTSLEGTYTQSDLMSAGGGSNNTPPHYFLEPSANATVEMLSMRINNKTLAGSTPNDRGEAVADQAAPIIKVLPVIERNFRWNWAVNPNINNIMSVLGSVNANSPEWLGGPPKETVLFLGFGLKVDYRWRCPPGTQILEPSSIPVATIDYKFAERRITDTPAAGADVVETITWNHFFNPANQKWQRLQRDTPSGLKPLYELRAFEESIFNALLTPEEISAIEADE